MPEPAAWKTLSQEEVFVDAPWVRLVRQHVALPSGMEIPNFYQVKLQEHAIVVASTDAGEILLERQYKHAIGTVATSFPAGFIEAGEAPLDAARRELREETGFEAAQWESLGAFHLDGNRGCGRAHIFRASGARKTREPVDDPSEAVHVELVKPARVVEALRRGEFLVTAHALACALAIGTPREVTP